ncbi:MAG: AAA family ATPase, partial [Chloroflexota bacterium]
MVRKKFLVGERIEHRYRVLSVVGTGGMGILYRVADEARENKIIGLKTVRLDVPVAEATESVRRFQAEFQILTQLQHPNLVAVYDYGITPEGELYFTMEWVEGHDLASKLRSWEPEATFPVMVQVCRALAYLHAHGVVHGDLKPSNVLVTGDQVKIVDFGVSVEVHSSQTRARYYTPGYSAPEVKLIRPIDQRADLYSLGAMWYALLVGEPPMFMLGSEQLIQLTLQETLETQMQSPIPLSGLITRLLATSPNDRYAGADEVIAELNRVMGSAYTLETPETVRSYALRTRFVNRETEMETLRALWNQALVGKAKLALVSGEAGMGKTRLVEEFVVKAELEGVRVARGQCIKNGNIAYRPWREVLRVLMRYIEGADGVDLKQVGPIVATLLPELWQRTYMVGLTPLADLEPQAMQERLNDGIARVLRAAASLRPVVVVLEDAHWADEASLVFLDFLARLPGQAGLLVCVTYRSDETGPEHPLRLLAGEGVQRLSLSSLSPGVTNDLVRSMLGLRELPALLQERVQQATEGNAFFVQELIRSLAEEGVVLLRTVSGWQVDHAALRAARLPESIRQVVWRRLEQLTATTRQVLRSAAVMGSVFWEGGVRAIGQVSRAQVRVALREGLEQELIREREESAFAGEREYLFASPTVREVAYESTSQEERRETHSRVAAWLMGCSDEEINEHLGLLAGHLEGAGLTEQAVTYLHRAGEQAAAQFANAEAIAYFSRALDLTPVDESARRYTLLLAREKVYDVRGEREPQSRDLAALEKLADILADDRRRAEVALRRANLADMTGDNPAAIAAAQEAITLAQAARDVYLEALSHQQWGRGLDHSKEPTPARSQYEQALALARAGQSSASAVEPLRLVEAACLSFFGLDAFCKADYATAQTYSEEALRIYRELGDRRGELLAVNCLGAAICETQRIQSGARGYLKALQDHFKQVLFLAHEVGDRSRESMNLNNMGHTFLLGGDYEQAKNYSKQAFDMAYEIGFPLVQGLALGSLGFIFDRLGDYAQAQEHLEKSLSILREIDQHGSEGHVLANLGLLFHHLGDNQAAWECSQQALHIFQEVGSVNQGLPLTNLGHALVGLGNLAEAADAYRQALAKWRDMKQYETAMEPLAGLARVALAQGDLAQAQTQVEEILSHLEINTLDGTDQPFLVYLTCYRVLLANQDPRAQAILATSYRLLQEQAAKITDEVMRSTFLEKVLVNRE